MIVTDYFNFVLFLQDGLTSFYTQNFPSAKTLQTNFVAKQQIILFYSSIFESSSILLASAPQDKYKTNICPWYYAMITGHIKYLSSPFTFCGISPNTALKISDVPCDTFSGSDVKLARGDCNEIPNYISPCYKSYIPLHLIFHIIFNAVSESMKQ